MRGLREAQIDARRLLDATEAALLQDKALLSPPEHTDIQCAMQTVYDQLEHIAAQGEGATVEVHQSLREALRNVTQDLNRITTPFAARRMDMRVRQALNGQRLEAVA